MSPWFHHFYTNPEYVTIRKEKETWFRRHVQLWKKCHRCSLHRHRENVVLYRGSIPCQVLFTGEAPGESEDLSGFPFTGPAGSVLDSILAATVIKASLTYGIANLIGCFPLDESDPSAHEFRKPRATEMKACWPRLSDLIHHAKPSLIVTLGAMAESRIKASSLKTRRINVYHPSYILRSDSDTIYHVNFRKTVLRINGTIRSMGLKPSVARGRNK